MKDDITALNIDPLLDEQRIYMLNNLPLISKS